MSTRSLKDGLPKMRVVQAAMDVFSVHGFRKARVEDLLRSAGIARRTFYKYFRNKTEVLSALYEYVTRELIQGIATARAESDDPLSGLRAALENYLHFHVTNHAIVRVLLEEALRSDSPLSPMRKQFRAGLVHALNDAYFSVTERRIDPFVFAGLVSALEGLSLDLLADGAPAEEDVERTRAAILGLLEATVRATDVFPEVNEA